MVNRTIVDEIVALGHVRVQKIFILYDHVLVFEIFNKQHRRLYVVFDHHAKTKTFHVQNERPWGPKTKAPLVLLLTKYVSDHFMRFFRLDEEGCALKAQTSVDDICLIFQREPTFSVGLFHGDKLLAALPPDRPPNFRAGFLVDQEHTKDLSANFKHARIYQNNLEACHHDDLITERLVQLKKELVKKKTLLKNVEQDRARSEQALAQQTSADLLKSQLHLLKRGMTEASVIDYTTDPPSTKIIALDPKRSPQEFLQNLFAKVKKAKRGIAIISERLVDIRTEIGLLEQQIENVKTTTIKPHSICEISNRTPARVSSERTAYRVFKSRDGITIWVGKSAKDSDIMVRKAAGNEWFFHVRDVPGAHVIVKSSDNLPEKTLLDAAMLAHHFSKQRDNVSALVTYTRVKYVTKKKGMAPGKVLITQEKNFEIATDQALLKNLLAHQA